MRAWRDPEKTVLLEALVPLSNAFRLSISCCNHAEPPFASSSLAFTPGSVVFNDCSFCTLLASCRFFCASCAIQSCFSLFRSCSARCSSSFSSKTRLSCAARAVKRFVSVDPVGEARLSGSKAGAAALTGEGVLRCVLVLMFAVWIGNGIDSRASFLDVSATDVDRLCDWKDNVEDEVLERDKGLGKVRLAGLVGLRMCSAGAGAS